MCHYYAVKFSNPLLESQRFDYHKDRKFNHEYQRTSQSIIFTLHEPPLSHRKNWYTVVHWSIKTFPFAKANTAWNCILGIQMSKSFLFHFENSLKDRFRQKFGKRDFAIVWEVESNQKWLFTHPTSFVSAYHWSIFNHPSNKAIFTFKIFMAILLAFIMKSRAF